MNFAIRSAAVAAGLLLFACNGADPDADEGADAADSLTESASALNAAQLHPVDPARELLITDLSVVEDPIRTTWPAGHRSGPEAAWTFGRLMEQLAGPNGDPSELALGWLNLWESAQTVNGFVAGARPLVKTLITDPWLAASGGAELDMRKAPFRLLAIVSRIDLRSPLNMDAEAGEGRFVFGAIKPDGTPLQFTVIFEYGVPADDADDVRAWAKRWHKLGAIPFGPSYNEALEKLTKKFTRIGCANSKPNKSCINQIRTNDVSLSPLPKTWELREFHLSPQGAIIPFVTARTPDPSFNGTGALADFINANEGAAIAKTHVTPPAFLGPASVELPAAPWTAPGIANNEARHGFALATCSGCHTGETGTLFTHIKPRAAGQAAKLSAFMTGETVADPISGATRTFNELGARVQDLNAVLAE